MFPLPTNWTDATPEGGVHAAAHDDIATLLNKIGVGGAPGDVPTKQSSADGDIAWAPVPSGGGAGGLSLGGLGLTNGTVKTVSRVLAAGVNQFYTVPSGHTTLLLSAMTGPMLHSGAVAAGLSFLDGLFLTNPDPVNDMTIGPWWIGVGHDATTIARPTTTPLPHDPVDWATGQLNQLLDPTDFGICVLNEGESIWVQADIAGAFGGAMVCEVPNPSGMVGLRFNGPGPHVYTAPAGGAVALATADLSFPELLDQVAFGIRYKPQGTSGNGILLWHGAQGNSGQSTPPSGSSWSTYSELMQIVLNEGDELIWDQEGQVVVGANYFQDVFLLAI